MTRDEARWPLWAAIIVATGMMAGRTSVLLRAQAPSAHLPSFEVASVKENTSGDTRARIQMQPGGRLVATNVLLKGLLAEAFGGEQPLHLSRVLNGPAWIDTARYDINAKASAEFPPSADGPPQQLILMVRSLLEERFHAKAHLEKRELPIYELVIARSDKRLGPRLSRVDLDCDAIAAARAAGTPDPPRQPTEPPPCGLMGGPARIFAGGITMQQVAVMLTSRLSNGFGPVGDQGRLVFDKTELSGRFAFVLEWTPEQIPTGTPPPGIPPIDPNGPSFFTALQEQLGLKLESAKGPVDVLIVDGVERPTPD